MLSVTSQWCMMVVQRLRPMTYALRAVDTSLKVVSDDRIRWCPLLFNHLDVLAKRFH